MPESDFRVPLVFEYVATFAWAASGSVVGIQKHFDITGVFVMALLSSTGGGLLRDGILLQRTPALLTDPLYLPLILAATVTTTLFTRILVDWRGGARLVDVIDAIGTPAFAVFGMQIAQRHDIPTPGVLLVGMVNGTGGGLLRDAVVSDVPALLRPGQFSTLTLLATSVLFLGLTNYGVEPTRAGWSTVLLFFIARVLTVRFNWRTKSVRMRPDQRRLPPPPPARDAPPPPPR